MQTRIQLAYLAKFSSEYLDLSGEIHRFDAAREIHEKLSHLLGDDKRVFFDQRIPEEIKEDHNELQQIDTISVDISSLDIVAWCYLKEELVNTSESKEVAYLKDIQKLIGKPIPVNNTHLYHVEFKPQGKFAPAPKQSQGGRPNNNRKFNKPANKSFSRQSSK